MGCARQGALHCAQGYYGTSTAPNIQTNPDTPGNPARQRSDKPPENAESQPKPRWTVAVRKDFDPAVSSYFDPSIS